MQPLSPCGPSAGPCARSPRPGSGQAGFRSRRRSDRVGRPGPRPNVQTLRGSRLIHRKQGARPLGADGTPPRRSPQLSDSRRSRARRARRGGRAEGLAFEYPRRMAQPKRPRASKLDSKQDGASRTPRLRVRSPAPAGAIHRGRAPSKANTPHAATTYARRGVRTGVDRARAGSTGVRRHHGPARRCRNGPVCDA